MGVSRTCIVSCELTLFWQSLLVDQKLNISSVIQETDVVLTESNIINGTAVWMKTEVIPFNCSMLSLLHSTASETKPTLKSHYRLNKLPMSAVKKTKSQVSALSFKRALKVLIHPHLCQPLQRNCLLVFSDFKWPSWHQTNVSPRCPCIQATVQVPSLCQRDQVCTTSRTSSGHRSTVLSSMPISVRIIITAFPTESVYYYSYMDM